MDLPQTDHVRLEVISGMNESLPLNAGEREQEDEDSIENCLLIKRYECAVNEDSGFAYLAASVFFPPGPDWFCFAGNLPPPERLS